MLKTTLINSRRFAGLAFGIGLLGAAVEALGGEISHELGIIKSVGAKLSDRQMQALPG